MGLDGLYGTWRKASTEKNNYNLPMPKMTNNDLSQLLKDQAIRQALREPKKDVKRHVLKKNPLKNWRTMMRLNPYANVQKKTAQEIERRAKAKRQEILDQKRGITSVDSSGGKARPRKTTASKKAAKK